MAIVQDFTELQVYRESYAAAMRIWRRTTTLWRIHRRLGDQTRSAAFAVPGSIAEAWGKRRYPRSFAATLVVGQGEANETRFWLESVCELGFIPESERADLDSIYRHLSTQLTDMSDNAESWCPPKYRKPPSR